MIPGHRWDHDVRQYRFLRQLPSHHAIERDLFESETRWQWWITIAAFSIILFLWSCS